MKKISIIIITLNEEKKIGNLLNDLKKQTYRGFEIIVVDSNSRDNTLKKAREFKRKFKEFRTFNLGFTKGPAWGRNKGAELAKYNELLFLDADTRLNMDFLEKLLEFKSKTKAEIVNSLVKAPEDSGFFTKLGYYFYNFLEYTFQIFPNLLVAHGSCLSSTKKIHKKIGGFDVTMKQSEDFRYIAEAKKIAKFRVIPCRTVFDNRRIEEEGSKYIFQSVRVSLYSFFTGKQLDDDSIKYEFGKHTN